MIGQCTLEVRWTKKMRSYRSVLALQYNQIFLNIKLKNQMEKKRWKSYKNNHVVRKKSLHREIKHLPSNKTSVIGETCGHWSTLIVINFRSDHLKELLTVN